MKDSHRRSGIGGSRMDEIQSRADSGEVEASSLLKASSGSPGARKNRSPCWCVSPWGTLLAERAGNVPIILDDALVYCEDDRVDLMFDALCRAGRHQQIIVLTRHTLRVQIDGEGH
jgi:hypothetical protein